MSDELSQQEFELQYAKKSQIELSALKEQGFCSTPCDCGDPTCKGWEAKFIKIEKLDG